MARSLFYVTGFITKEKRNSSTERTGPGFTAFKASADRPAKKNRTSDVISNQPIKTGHVFSPTRGEADHVFTDQARSCSRNSPTRKVGSAFFRIHVYCVSSPCSADPAWLSVVGFCGQSNIVKLSAMYHTRTRPLTSSPIGQSRCPSEQQAGHVTHRPAIASKNRPQGIPHQLSNIYNNTCTYKKL